MVRRHASHNKLTNVTRLDDAMRDALVWVGRVCGGGVLNVLHLDVRGAAHAWWVGYVAEYTIDQVAVAK